MPIKKKIPFRFWIGVMIFFTSYMSYSMRIFISVNLLAMVTEEQKKDDTKPAILPPNKMPIAPFANPVDKNVTRLIFSNGLSTSKNIALEYLKSNNTFKKYPYDQRIQGQILAGYGYGYILSSIPGGFLAEYCGPYRTILFSNFVEALFTLAAIPAAMIHWSAVFVTRIIAGICAGTTYPSLYILISKWSPPNEKGKFIAALMGSSLGSCVTLPLVALVCDKLNWTAGFIFVSVQTMTYLLAHWIFVTDTPEENKFISKEESDYIVKERGPAKKKLVAPYWKIITCVAFWGLVGASFGNLWGLMVLQYSIPKFFKENLGFALKNTGALVVAPALMRMISGFTFGIVGDCLLKKYTATIIRKSFIILSHFIPGLCLIIMMFVSYDWRLAITFLAINQLCNGAVVVTILQNHQDLSPNFAGSLFGTVNCICSICVFLVPIVTAEFTAHKSTLAEWRWIFLIGGLMYVTGGILFLLIGSAKVQPWNQVTELSAEVT